MSSVIEKLQRRVDRQIQRALSGLHTGRTKMPLTWRSVQTKVVSAGVKVVKSVEVVASLATPQTVATPRAESDLKSRTGPKRKVRRGRRGARTVFRQRRRAGRRVRELARRKPKQTPPVTPFLPSRRGRLTPQVTGASSASSSAATAGSRTMAFVNRRADSRPISLTDYRAQYTRGVPPFSGSPSAGRERWTHVCGANHTVRNGPPNRPCTFCSRLVTDQSFSRDLLERRF
jgi:hypothetical protein